MDPLWHFLRIQLEPSVPRLPSKKGLLRKLEKQPSEVSSKGACYFGDMSLVLARAITKHSASVLPLATLLFLQK